MAFYDAPWAKSDPWLWFGHDCHFLGDDRKLGNEGEPGIEYRRLLSPDKLLRLGEDLTFSVRANQLGLKIKGYTGLPLLHIKMQKQICDFMTPMLDDLGVKLQRLGGSDGGVAASSKKIPGKSDGLDGKTAKEPEKDSWLGPVPGSVEPEEQSPDGQGEDGGEKVQG
jgi:hypothetical protein